MKWIFNTGPVAIQSVETGPDGTIYFGASVNKIFAVNPDGTLKWTITDPSGAQVGAGPDVGPDGKIYAVTEDAGLPNGLGRIRPSHGLGRCSLIAPITSLEEAQSFALAKSYLGRATNFTLI